MSQNNDINKIHLPSIPSQTGSNNNTDQASSQNIDLGPFQAALDTLNNMRADTSNNTSQTQGGNGSQENNNSSNGLGSIIAYVQKAIADIMKNFQGTGSEGNTGSGNNKISEFQLMQARKKFVDAQLKYNAETRKYNVSWSGVAAVMDSMGANSRIDHRNYVDQLQGEMEIARAELAQLESQLANQNQQQQFNIINPLA